jgi:hypothetical protein
LWAGTVESSEKRWSCAFTAPARQSKNAVSLIFIKRNLCFGRKYDLRFLIFIYAKGKSDYGMRKNCGSNVSKAVTEVQNNG